MCGTICRAYYSAKELPNLDFLTSAMKREKGRKHSLSELSCQMCQSAGREQKHQQCVQLTILIFLFNEIRGGVWLVWHRNCQALTLQRFRSEHRSCCLPGGTQEPVQVFEIQGLSIIKKKVTHVAGKHCSPHWSDFGETLRKSLILVPFCKNNGGILKSLHWYGMLFSAVRLYCLQQSEIGLRRWSQDSAFFLLFYFVIICCILT